MPDTPPPSSTPPTLADLAIEVRAKNAGPFWVTMELFMADAEGYAVAADPAVVDEAVIARLYGVPEADVRIFRIPSLNVVKISYPRPVGQGGLRDRDLHAGQHHVPLAGLPVPVGPGTGDQASTSPA
jgi:uncharacterized protein DUF4387